MRQTLWIPVLILLSLESQALETLAVPDAATVKTLNDFSVSFETRMSGEKTAAEIDDQFKIIAGELNKLSKNIAEAQLPAVEAYALTKQGEKLRWWLAFFFVERGKFDSAAHLYVEDLVHRKEQRSYVMWKYWESYFIERKDYRDLSHRISISLMRQFETGNAEYKLVVAELFGKGEAESKLTVEEFKKAIDWKSAKEEK